MSWTKRAATSQRGGRAAAGVPRRIVVACAWVAAGVLLFELGAPLRHYLLALLNDPLRLPALEKDPRIHFEPAAKACAVEVAALAPAVMARIETAQGRPFARSPVIAVYASFDAYARANGLEDKSIAATARAGRVILSPTLCGDERLERILTHELSHSHLFGWRSPLSSRPPGWFTEGLAVMVSGGGGAEGVSDADAAGAIRRGYAIKIAPDPWRDPWRDFATIGFDGDGDGETTGAFRQRLAYRQAGMFVGWLQGSDREAFGHLLQHLEDGQAFDPAFTAAYGSSARAEWRRFAAQIGDAR